MQTAAIHLSRAKALCDAAAEMPISDYKAAAALLERALKYILKAEALSHTETRPALVRS